MTADGAKRQPSDDPTAHRQLVVLDPPMAGRDVANVQAAVKARLASRHVDVPTPVHGKWTQASALAAVEAGYFLGLESTTYLAREKVGNDQRLALSTGAQKILRQPATRNPAQLSRAKERQGQLERGPRYYSELAHGLGAPAAGGSMEKALAWAVQQVGVHESPAGSNWGHPVQDWEQLAGYTSAVPWCGCFDNRVCFEGGVTSGPSIGIGFVPSLAEHAKAGTAGWRWAAASDGHPGYLACFADSSGELVHTGVVLERLSASLYKTVEGNTSSGDGSQSDGGIVAIHERATTGSFRVACFAIPPWVS